MAADDIAALMERCRAAGLRLLDEAPRTGAGGKQIAFLHPKAGGGVLLEICAAPSPAGRGAGGGRREGRFPDGGRGAE